MDVGDLLIEAKKRVGHGNFEAWVGTECQLSFRAARRYMGMAKNRVKIEAQLNAKSARVADLSAQRLLAPPDNGGRYSYDKVQKKLIENLKKLGASEAEAAATETIREITEVDRRLHSLVTPTSAGLHRDCLAQMRGFFLSRQTDGIVRYFGRGSWS